jgi:branched-chain amino acid aminotransferase
MTGGGRVVFVNGRLRPVDEPVLDVTERGFQLGDGVFETLRVVAGQILDLSLHVERLRASAGALAIVLPLQLEEILLRAVAELCAANGLDGPGAQAAVRVTASRGAYDGRSLLPPPGLEATLAVQAWAVEPPSPELLAKGLAVVISEVRRDPLSPLARVKTTSRAEFVYARIEAERRGGDDAVFLTTDGHLAEASTASLFLVDKGGLATPSLDCGILVSTTRQWVIATGAPRLGLGVREGLLDKEELFRADEAFLASSVAGIVPVTRADSKPIGSGAPGPVALALRELREEAAAAAARRPS